MSCHLNIRIFVLCLIVAMFCGVEGGVGGKGRRKVGSYGAKAAGSFQCRDNSRTKDCKEWKRNMGGNCKGKDYEYMLRECPRTCGLCGDAMKRFKESPTFEPEDSKVVVLTPETIEDYLEYEVEEEGSLILLGTLIYLSLVRSYVAPPYSHRAETTQTMGRTRKHVLTQNLCLDPRPQNFLPNGADIAETSHQNFVKQRNRCIN